MNGGETISSPTPRAARLRNVLRGLSDVVFPPVCLHCEGLVVESRLRHLCARCEPLIARVRSPHCTTCGHPFYGEIEGERLCTHCDGLRPAYRRGRTVVLFKGPARALVHALKYHHALHVMPDIEAVIRGHAEILDYVRDAILVPVPLHPTKERHRGYNQGLLLAQAFARAAGGGTRVEPLLKRVRVTQSQTQFNREARRANLKNAFALSGVAPINPDHHYLLIDDVFTTGSTLNACAAVLREAGCLNLDVLTFGHG